MIKDDRNVKDIMAGDTYNMYSKNLYFKEA